MTPIILASESPRRRELLSNAGYKFDVVPVKVSEIPNKNLNANDQILDISARKLEAAKTLLKSQGRQDGFVICADTEVIFQDQPLGKPEDATDAARILRLLSGQKHEVITAVSILDLATDLQLSQSETTTIQFRSLSEDEIWTYIQTGEPMDKAGAYGIQGHAKSFVQRIEGPFDNVVGLPLDLVRKLLFQLRVKTCLPAKTLAVSKLQAPEKIRELYQQGQRLFGENYVQEALEKLEQLQDLKEIQWHFIGHLQKNKAKQVVGKFSLIHSVDSISLAETLSRLCVTRGVEQDVLLQVNLANEDSKGGFSKDLLLKEWPLLKSLPGLNIKGLMTMPPLTEIPEQVRPYFVELRDLNAKLGLKELSMGTSHDYRVAVDEGATIVRLGTILFGERATGR